MIMFWIAAAGLTGLALLFIVPPLLSKRTQREDVDQDDLNLAVFRQQLGELDADLAAGKLDRQQHAAARRDLERELLYDVSGSETEQARDVGGGRWAAGLLAVAVPAAAVALYLYLGDSTMIRQLQAAADGLATAAHSETEGKMPSLDVMVQRLAAKLEQDPNNLEGWMILGRTFFAVDQPERALYALEKAYNLAPQNPDVLVAFAEAVAANNDSTLAGRPAELIQAALEIEPQHTGARWLEGLASFQAAEYEQAAEQWGALVATFAPQSEEAAELNRYIAEARSRAISKPEQTPQRLAQMNAGPSTGQEEIPTAGGAEKTRNSATAPAPAAAMTVEVSLAAPLWPQADVNDSVFVYAKAVSGPPMPLAARRARVADLPLTVTLDDSMAMVPAMKLSGFNQVTVGARISKSGQAIPQSGDLEGEVSPVEPGQTDTVQVVIDRIRP